MAGREWLISNTMKNKLSSTRYFLKSFEDLLQGKLTAREVLIYGIVSKFEENQTPCFISRQELAKRINESEATAERAVQLLITEGWLKFSREGRKRYLYTSYPNNTDLYQPDTDEVPNLYQNEGRSVSKHGSDLYQVDTLTRLITRSINRPKTTRLETKLVWSEEKQAMVRVRR